MMSADCQLPTIAPANKGIDLTQRRRVAENCWFLTVYHRFFHIWFTLRLCASALKINLIHCRFYNHSHAFAVAESGDEERLDCMHSVF